MGLNRFIAFGMALGAAASLAGQAVGGSPTRAMSTSELLAGTARDVSVTAVTFEGRQAVEVEPPAASLNAGGGLVLAGPDFHNGEITALIAADVNLPGRMIGSRAFAGIAFRVSGAAYEALYLRMLNGRAATPLQRSHSTQYISEPGYPWERLRKETPGVYESYADLRPAHWTPVRIVVCGDQAALYVNGATRPTLLVHDLKRGAESHGQVMLWVGPGTVARFTDVSVHATATCEAAPG